MKMRKEMWYVIALVVLVLLVAVVFADKINFSPGKQVSAGNDLWVASTVSKTLSAKASNDALKSWVSKNFGVSSDTGDTKIIRDELLAAATTKSGVSK